MKYLVAVLVTAAAIVGITAASYVTAANPQTVNRAAKADRLGQQSSVNFEDRWSAIQEFKLPALKQWAIDKGLLPASSSPPVVAKGK